MTTRMDELLKPDEVAKILRVTPQAVYQMNKRGTLKAVDLGLKSIRFRREDVERLIGGKVEAAQ